jgi:hypothetical protein
MAEVLRTQRAVAEKRPTLRTTLAPDSTRAAIQPRVVGGTMSRRA